MKVVAFFGSPRVHGNTDLLLEETLKPIREAGHDIVSFKLNLMNIKPCQNCGGCTKTGVCVVDDAMKEVSAAIRSADRVILASPIFFFGLSAQAKAMIDRCQAFWCDKYLLKKTIPAGPRGRKGLLIVVGGMKKEDGIHCAETTARAFFRTISIPEHATVSFLGVDAKGEILNHPTALKDVYEAGKKLIG
jgi:multimeric flavodoxin WrbA